MKYLKIFDEVGNHIGYYNANSTVYPNVGVYRENVLFDPNYSRVYFVKDSPAPTAESNEE